MKIVLSNYDTINNPFYSGGGAIIIDEVTSRLAKNHEILVICGAHRESKNTKIKNITYKYIGLKRVGPFVGQILFSMLLPIYVFKEKYDIWIESFVPPHSTNILCFFTKKPVIGLTSILDAKSFSKKYRFPFYLIENYGLTRYKYFIALNEKIKNKIKKINSHANIVVIPPGIQSSFLNLTPSDHNYALYLGRIDVTQKGIDLLLRAWTKVNKTIPHIKLVLAGSGTSTEQKYLQSLLMEYKLTENVVLKGNVRGGKKNKLISECTFAIFPSRFETFGISALELLAAQKPIICYDIDGYSWIPKALAIKVKKESVSKLAEAIIEMSKNKTERIKLGKAGRLFARKFAWDKIANNYESYIQEIIKNI